MAVGRWTLIRVALRALLIQASWSPERMQSVGFAFAMMPALRRLYPDRRACLDRLAVHLEYFNTQPYLASFTLGAAVRLEEERALGGNPAADVSALKAALMGPLGALGDSVYWGGLKPFAAALSAALALAGAWWAPLVFFAVYNAWHLRQRVHLVSLGSRRTQSRGVSGATSIVTSLPLIRRPVIRVLESGYGWETIYNTKAAGDAPSRGRLALRRGPSLRGPERSARSR